MHLLFFSAAAILIQVFSLFSLQQHASTLSETNSMEPQIGIERSRQRVQARTGLKGAGENKSFRFDDGCEDRAVKEAQDWLRTRWVDELGRDPECLPFH